MPVYVGGCSIESGNIASSNKTPTMDPDLTIRNLRLRLFFGFFPDHHGKRRFWRQVGAVDVHHQAILLADDLACATVYLVKKEYGSGFCQTLNFNHHPARLRTLDGRLFRHIIQDLTSQKRLRVTEPSKKNLKQFWKNKIKHLSSPSGGWAYLTPWKEAYGLPEVLLVHL